jgi:hypothetical protein
MIDAHYEELLERLGSDLPDSHGMDFVNGGQEAGFAVIELIRRTHRRIKPIDLVETYGALVNAGRASEASTVLWDEYGEQTIEAIADGCRTLAMLWESAWREGGGDGNIPDAQLRTRNWFNLRQIYYSQDFVPSVPLGPSDDGTIDTYLFP